LTFKGNTISNVFYYNHIIEIPTNKGAYSFKRKLSKIGKIHKYRDAATLCYNSLYIWVRFEGNGTYTLICIAF